MNCVECGSVLPSSRSRCDRCSPSVRLVSGSSKDDSLCGCALDMRSAHKATCRRHPSYVDSLLSPANGPHCVGAL